MPLHALHSHWLTVDVPATFWIMLALYWSARLMQLQDGLRAGDPSLTRGRKIQPAVWAGMAAGLASATKYNAALAILPVLHAAWPLRRGTSTGPTTRQAAIWTAAAVLSFAMAFLIGCPGSVLDSKAFVHDVSFEARHVGAQADEPFQQTGSGFVYHVATNLYYGMGWPLLLVSLVSLVYAGMRRERADGLLAVFAFPYYALIGFAVVRYARYAIPLLPFLALWTARMLAALMASSRVSVRRAAGALAGAVAAATAVFGIFTIAPMAGRDPRDRAVDWIGSHGYTGQPIGFATMPWFYTPPVDPAFGSLGRGGWRSTPLNPPGWQSLYIYHDKDWDMTVLDIDRPPVVLLSQYEYKDALRLKRSDALAFLARLQADYRPAAEFGGYGDREIGPRGLPHDMMYANPATWVFVRK
jgi:hypothetical protein